MYIKTVVVTISVIEIVTSETLVMVTVIVDW